VSYDLFLLDQSGSLRQRPRSEAIASALAEIPEVAGTCAVRASYSQPDELDVETLEEALEEEPETARRFQAFCRARGVDPKLAAGSADTAAEFLDHCWGASLATVSLPSGRREAIAAFAALVAFAIAHGCRLSNPQTGTDVDLESPGQLPGLWE